MTDRFYHRIVTAIINGHQAAKLLEIIEAEKELSDQHKSVMRTAIKNQTHFEVIPELNHVEVRGEFIVKHVCNIDRNETMFDTERVEKAKGLIKACFFDYLFNPEHGKE